MRVSEIRVKRIRVNQGLGVPEKNHGPYSNVTMSSVAFFLLELQKIIHTCTLDVLWGQPIKLIQVASNSELLEIVPSREQ